jgi:coenzyme PQQ precursor peptide PqqA
MRCVAPFTTARQRTKEPLRPGGSPPYIMNSASGGIDRRHVRDREELSGNLSGRYKEEETIMAWTTPTLVEICVGLEINGYLPAEF